MTVFVLISVHHGKDGSVKVLGHEVYPREDIEYARYMVEHMQKDVQGNIEFRLLPINTKRDGKEKQDQGEF